MARKAISDQRMKLKLEKDCTLIKEVKQYTFLYDRNDMNYKRMEKRKEAWDEIGQVLRKDGIDCMNRWNLLRDRYRKEKRLNSTESNGTNRVRKKWVFFDMMSFVDLPLEEVKPMTGTRELLNHNIKKEPVDEDTIHSGYEEQGDDCSNKSYDYEELLNYPQELESSVDEPVPHQNSMSSQEDSNNSENFNQKSTSLQLIKIIIPSTNEQQNLQYVSKNVQNRYNKILQETVVSSGPIIVNCIKKELVEEEAFVVDKVQDNDDNSYILPVIQNTCGDTSVTGDNKELLDHPQKSESVAYETTAHRDSQSSSQEDSDNSQNFHQNYAPRSLKLQNSQFTSQNFQRGCIEILPNVVQVSCSTEVTNVKNEVIQGNGSVNDFNNQASCDSSSKIYAFSNSCGNIFVTRHLNHPHSSVDESMTYQPSSEGTSNSLQSFAPLSLIRIEASDFQTSQCTNKYVKILPKNTELTYSTMTTGFVLKPLEEKATDSYRNLTSHDNKDKSDDPTKLVTEVKNTNVTNWGSKTKKLKRLTKGKFDPKKLKQEKKYEKSHSVHHLMAFMSCSIKEESPEEQIKICQELSSVLFDMKLDSVDMLMNYIGDIINKTPPKQQLPIIQNITTSLLDILIKNKDS